MFGEWIEDNWDWFVFGGIIVFLLTIAIIAANEEIKKEEANPTNLEKAKEICPNGILEFKGDWDEKDGDFEVKCKERPDDKYDWE